MNMKPQIRHSKWYERIFFSTTTQIVITSLFCAVLPAWLLWGERFFSYPAVTETNSFFGVIACNICIIFTLKFLLRFPGNKSSSFIISAVLTWYLLLLVILFIFRLPYSVYFLAFSLCLSLFYGFLGFFFGRRWVKPKIALIPFGRAKDLPSIPHATWYLLTEPRLEDDRRYNMIVADLHSEELSAEWQKFLAYCVLSGMPVYNARQIEESLSGRVKIRHLYENHLGSLLPSLVYSVVKRWMEVIFVLCALPIAIPIMVIVSIIIMLESRGGPLFTQLRVGKGGKEFRIYKFRSMTVCAENSGPKFTTADDQRITKVGKFIRKTRMDELPQFFNILKGDMSLIGPRPEQKIFVDAFEEQIPFYNYRHIVRPGISGWAQVMQGYAADVSDNQVKVEHDFYYIKNFSLWLDMLILFKTIKIMLTGFGAR